MKLTANRLIGSIGTALGALMFLTLIPSGATLIFSLMTRERGSDTVPAITFCFDLAFSSLTLALQGADIAMLALFLTKGRKNGLLTSCVFLFGGLLMNMLFSGMCMLISDAHVRAAAAYCLATGMLFLASALALSIRKSECGTAPLSHTLK